ncbi:MAG: biotin/lipoyl-containing protein [Planctomycetaceae bacterium]
MSALRLVPVRMPAGSDRECLQVKPGVWLVEPGDAVHVGDALAELILPGLLFQLRSPVAGRIATLRYLGDSIVPDETVLCEIFVAHD